MLRLLLDFVVAVAVAVASSIQWSWVLSALPKSDYASTIKSQLLSSV